VCNRLYIKEKEMVQNGCLPGDLSDDAISSGYGWGAAGSA
jgi:hypothetical protein